MVVELSEGGLRSGKVAGRGPHSHVLRAVRTNRSTGGWLQNRLCGLAVRIESDLGIKVRRD